MGIVIFSDVHADITAISAFGSCIKKTAFTDHFGNIDYLVNLGDILHRGNHPREALEFVHLLSKRYRLISVMGNHDHAFLNRIPVSGSDAASSYMHEQVRGAPLLSLFLGMPMEWVHKDMLFVHGGPLDLGTSTLRLKCWQRLGKESGDFYTGFHYTPDMAFSELRSRGLNHMCCGHQHSALCLQKTANEIKNHGLGFSSIDGATKDLDNFYVAQISLDMPTVLRVGPCHGKNPEFAYTDFKTFSFIRIK